MVDRYELVDLESCGQPWREMKRRQDGEWVTHDDYAVLEKELADCKAGLARVKAEVPCPECDGTGWIYNAWAKCKACNGTGKRYPEGK